MIHRLLSLIGRFRSDERGAFLALFGVSAVVLIAMSGAMVDFVSVEQARTRAQTALDSAVLALQPKIYDISQENLGRMAQALLLESLGTSEGWKLCQNGATAPCAQLVSATTDPANGLINLKASVDVPLYFVALVGIDHMTASVISEAQRGSLNVEVALALDITGSMSGSKISDLRTATQELIDLVVQDVQTPIYSKLAIAPYSSAVNVGPYAQAVRGPIIGPKTITGASWAKEASLKITQATKTDPVVITTSGKHNYVDGDWVYISGVSGMSQINNKVYRIKGVSKEELSLTGVNGTNFDTYTSGGKVTRCLASQCAVVVTAAKHDFANDDVVYISGVGGMSQINNNVFKVADATANTFVLSGTVGPDYDAYTSGGSSYCTKQGCEYYYFPNAVGGSRLFPVNTCATERTTDAYTDVAPSTTPLGRNYAKAGSCPTSTIVPLSTDKAMLKDVAGKLPASGSTAGHIGVAWAWYLISPKFGYLWPVESRPASETVPNVLKVVVLMTDGDFNTAYCNGVVSKDTGSGSGSSSDHIDCNATNGSSYSQALAQCQAMKLAGIEVYTVGFDVGNSPNAMDIMAKCATDSSHAFTANTGNDLKAAFQQIGANIAALRVTR